MFTGIVQEVGDATLTGHVLTVTPPLGWPPTPPQEGESIAIDGCCLTVVPGSTSDRLLFHLSPETLARTHLGSRTRVNLERALRMGDALGGHFVQGHIDGQARVEATEPTPDGGLVMRVHAPGAAPMLVEKGSVTLDGVSLTVVRPEGERFEVWLIPHTLAETTLPDRRPGDPLNIEFDVIAKHVARLLDARGVLA